MKTVYTSLLLMLFSLVNAQTITFNGCHPLFDNQDFVFTQDGTDATGRHTYTTTPVDGQSCSGLGTCEFKMLWNAANSRWEFTADTGNGDFIAPYVIYTNASASTPNPPSISLGVWAENNTDTTGSCSGPLTSGNATLSGDVQNVLSVSDFSINKGIVLYPNPTTRELNIKSNSLVKEITVWSIQGQKVLAFANVSLIDVSGLQSGMYVTRIQTQDGLQVANFIKK